MNPDAEVVRVLGRVPLVPASRRPSWEATIAGWGQGIGYVAGKAAHPDDVAQGLTEYLAATPDPDFAPRHVVRYVAKAEQRRTTQPRPIDEHGRELGYIEQVARGLITVEGAP
jgi:hypothetical protein